MVKRVLSRTPAVLYVAALLAIVLMAEHESPGITWLTVRVVIHMFAGLAILVALIASVFGLMAVGYWLGRGRGYSEAMQDVAQKAARDRVVPFTRKQEN